MDHSSFPFVPFISFLSAAAILFGLLPLALWSAYLLELLALASSALRFLPPFHGGISFVASSITTTIPLWISLRFVWIFSVPLGRFRPPGNQLRILSLYPFLYASFLLSNCLNNVACLSCSLSLIP